MPFPAEIPGHVTGIPRHVTIHVTISRDMLQDVSPYMGNAATLRGNARPFVTDAATTGAACHEIS